MADKEHYKLLYKTSHLLTSFPVVVVGDSGVGKTNVAGRFVNDQFNSDTKATICVEFTHSEVTLKDGTNVKIQIWDTAGQERFRALARGYYRGAAGALIVFDVTKLNTFDNVESWLRELRDFTEGPLTIMMVGNKCDLTQHREVSTEQAIAFSEENELMYIETSALMGDNIREAFNQLVQGIYEANTKGKMLEQPSTEKTSTIGSPEETKREKIPDSRQTIKLDPAPAPKPGVATVTLLVCVALFGLVAAQYGGCRSLLRKLNHTVAVGVAKMTATGKNGRAVDGTVIFTGLNATHTSVTINVTGLAAGETLRGIHVHQYGDLSDTVAALSTGSHFNPFNQSHRCESAGSARHSGDMGNWNVDANGAVLETKVLDLLPLTGDQSVIGLAVVVHNQTDDCLNISSAGSRIAFGIIGVANVVNNTASASTTYAGGIAVAHVTPTTTASNFTSGTVYFHQTPQDLLNISAAYVGISTTHAHHIHQFGDLRDTTGLGTGGHFNPYNANHGIPPLSPRHVGDLGNVFYNVNDTGYYGIILTDGFTFLNQQYPIIGRGVILHSTFDNCQNPVGNAGSRLGYGVVGVANPQYFSSFTSAAYAEQNTTACVATPTSTSSASTADSTTASTSSTASETTATVTTSESSSTSVTTASDINKPTLTTAGAGAVKAFAALSLFVLLALKSVRLSAYKVGYIWRSVVCCGVVEMKEQASIHFDRSITPEMFRR
ncbi:ras-related protein Rab-11B-like [Planoprotostelium fungivorum]|uniref:Ras-related protein Rab-11B-like n=1 Tax=Planoprotostelium fungivorum TaxID=1890364 RepID=A0A2P6NGZ7_9EUKA|nr:ras-related protein Rab-11B-like [Planoprotostelium fungivorum]